MMAKDPAFLFYSSDFLTGIQDLTMEERGQYITLLCLQHQKGRLSKKIIGIATADATADVLAKFIEDENGLFYNVRLEEETKKRASFSEKQRQRAIDGWKKRKGKHATADATALPLENEDVNIEKGVKGEKQERKNDDRPVAEILAWFTEQYGPMDHGIEQNELNCMSCLESLIESYPHLRGADVLFEFIKAGMQDNFHKKNMTNFKYIFLNLNKFRIIYEDTD